MAGAENNIGVIRGVAVGSYGQVVQVTLKDLDDVAQDVSAYDGVKLAVAKSPDKLNTIKATASFTNTGSDGLVEWEWQTSDIDRPGMWEVQVVLNKTGGRAKSYIADMPVIRQLEEDS